MLAQEKKAEEIKKRVESLKKKSETLSTVEELLRRIEGDLDTMLLLKSMESPTIFNIRQWNTLVECSDLSVSDKEEVKIPEELI
jgi:transcriptional regulator